MPAVDLWFDFASSYSYPTVMRAGALASEAGVSLRYRPFLLGPIFKAQGWDTSPFNLYEAKGRYMWRDLHRLCADLGLPFRRPSPFPQNGLLAARVALAGEGKGWLCDFCRGIFSAQFGEGRRIDDPAVVGDVLTALGVPHRPTFELAQSDPVKTRLRAQTEEAGQRGIFGAPSFTTEDGELFWGNDRLEAALAWARKSVGNPA